MSLKYWAFIYLSPGFSPEKNTYECSVNNCKFKAIGIDVFNKEQVVAVAQQLVAEGVQTIELCGGFGPTWVSKICEAINYAVPVGGVMYGPEFRKPLAELMQFKN
jgi:hypothetical protein